mgnify:CR=1 FL=1
MCSICAIENKKDDDFVGLFNEGEIDKFLRKIYNQEVTKRSLDIEYYYKVADFIMKGVYNGFGKDSLSVVWGTPDFDMLKSLKENVYIFSAAKNYQQTREIGTMLSTENGIKPFDVFKKEASKVFATYNENYLRAEYNSAIAQARSARNWMEIEKDVDVFSQLQYETAGDGRVRPEHVSLDGMVRPVNDKFWDKYYPPNGWNCRCIVLQVNDLPNSDMRKFKTPTEKEVPEIFQFNAGKTKQIFSEKHPYFEVAKWDKEFAKQNFNMPLP